MKKFSFIALVALAGWGLSSCDEYTLPNPPAQSNEQEKLFEEGDVALKDAAGGTINLVSTEAAVIKLFDVTPCSLPEGYTIKVIGQMAADNSFTGTADFDCITNVTSTDEVESVSIYANVDALNEAFVEIFGNNPAAKTAYVRYAAYAVNGSTQFRLGTPDTYYATETYSITPIGPGHVIESAYYLVTSAGNWNVSDATAMIQTTPGDAYDNPEFTVTFSVSKADATAGFKYKIIPASAFKAGNLTGAYGMEPADAFTGELVAADGQDNAGTIPYAGEYKLSVNMLQLTFSLGYNFEYLYVATSATSSSDTSKMQKLPTDNRSYYRGVAVLNRSFHLTGMAEDATTGFSNAESTSGDDDYSGKLQYGATSPFTSMKVGTKKALYMVVANLGDNKWSANEIKNIGAVGDFQGWDPSKAPTFTHSANFLTWTIKDLELNGNDFKFCANGGWGINFGGSVDNLVVDGGNISNYGGAGKYDITLDFSTLPYTATIVKK